MASWIAFSHSSRYAVVREPVWLRWAESRAAISGNPYAHSYGVYACQCGFLETPYATMSLYADQNTSSRLFLNWEIMPILYTGIWQPARVHFSSKLLYFGIKTPPNTPLCKDDLSEVLWTKIQWIKYKWAAFSSNMHTKWAYKGYKILHIKTLAIPFIQN